ncbi:MAG: hypothetical protein AAF647_07100 [Pseudomonadota bacterium]
MKRMIPLLLAAAFIVGGAVFLMMPSGQSSMPQLGAANAQAVESVEELNIADMTLGA